MLLQKERDLEVEVENYLVQKLLLCGFCSYMCIAVDGLGFIPIDVRLFSSRKLFIDLHVV